jgi:hypothetical protein
MLKSKSFPESDMAVQKIQHERLKAEEGAPCKSLYRAKISTDEFLAIALNEGLGSFQTPRLRWNGVSSREEVFDIQQNGYIPKGKKAVKAPQFEGETDSLYMERAVVGQFPDVAAYLRGEPESMLNMVFDPQPTPTIHLAAMMNVTGGIDAEDQQKHADEVYRCIRALQNAGNQVTLTALFYNNMLSCIEELQVEVLREGQVLSQATLGARFHLSFYRVCWFNWAVHHFGNCGGSIRPKQFVDNGQRIVIPSCEFMPRGKSIMDIVQDGVKVQRAAASV